MIERYAIEHHLYAGDTRLSDDQSVATSISNMEHSIDALHTWYSSKRVQLNSTMSDIIWLGTRASLKRLKQTDLSLDVGTVVIKRTSVLRVLLDSELAN